jgi:hypothetical protein
MISTRVKEVSRFLICLHLLDSLNLLETNSVFTKLDAARYRFLLLRCESYEGAACLYEDQFMR